MKNKNLSKLLRNIAFFIILVGITFFLLFKDQNLGSIFDVVKQVKLPFIFLAICCMAIFVLAEATNIGRTVQLFGKKVSFLKKIKYALVGFFFSSITPSATGGQPMQVYYMHKDGIPVSHSTLALLIELASFELVTVLFAVIGYITHFSFLQEIIGNLQYLLLFGVLLNIVILLVLLMSIFSKRVSSAVIRWVISVLKFFHYKKWESLQERLLVHLEEYQRSAVYFKQNKKAMVKIFLTTVIQIAAYHSVPYFIYLAFGLSGYSAWTIISMQAILYVTVCALPLPGAVGISESGFMILYKVLFTEALVSGAMLLSRGISFYLMVAVSGIVVSIATLRLKSKRKDVVEK